MGSSKSRISGRWAMARAKPTRAASRPRAAAGTSRLHPVQADHGQALPHAPVDVAAVRRVSRRSGKATFCQTVMLSNSAPSWNDMPNLRRNSVISRFQGGRPRPVHLDRAGVGAEQADDVLEQHALPRARAADDDQRLAGGDVQVHAVEDHLGAEDLWRSRMRILGSAVGVVIRRAAW